MLQKAKKLRKTIFIVNMRTLVFALFIPTMLIDQLEANVFNSYRARNTKCQYLVESPCRVDKKYAVSFWLNNFFKMIHKIDIQK
jgi:hypothetical protein